MCSCHGNTRYLPQVRPLLPAVVIAAVSTFYFLCLLISPNARRSLRGKRQENGWTLLQFCTPALMFRSCIVCITHRGCRTHPRGVQTRDVSRYASFKAMSTSLFFVTLFYSCGSVWIRHPSVFRSNGAPVLPQLCPWVNPLVKPTEPYFLNVPLLFLRFTMKCWSG